MDGRQTGAVVVMVVVVMMMMAEGDSSAVQWSMGSCGWCW
jgi:hypothetical protein